MTPSQRTLEYVKEKEKDLDGIVEEYQTGVTSFIDRVEKLHQVENSVMVNKVKKQRQSFVDSCEDGSRVCDGFIAKLEQCSISGRDSRGLEEWLEHGRGLQRELGS